MQPRGALPRPISAAIFFLFINLVIGTLFVPYLMSTGQQGELALDAVHLVLTGVIFHGLNQRASWARPWGLAYTGCGYLLDLASSGRFLSTTLLAFICLLAAGRNWNVMTQRTGDPALPRDLDAAAGNPRPDLIG